MRWGEFAAAAPALASFLRERLSATGILLLGTLRADGWPRISPCEAYLVEDERGAAFRAEVERLAAEFAEPGASVELTGPWPPYNFVERSIEATR